MTFDNVVMIKQALSAKRYELRLQWQSAHEMGHANEAYWAERIQAVNDADAAFDRTRGAL